MSDPEKKQSTPPPDRAARFVDFVLEKCRQDKGYAARLRRADNPDTEYQSWELLAGFGINLEKEDQRLPFALTAAALARSKAAANGSLTLGRAIARCYEKGSESDQARARIRRLLACEDTAELCRILRSLVTLVQSRIEEPLDYADLLRQLLRFPWNRQDVKARWARQFYAKSTAAEEP
ncbi:type I-E CRISPR-associated protein Cse2/CasB [Thermodesulfobacteriota bacterium B35]